MSQCYTQITLTDRRRLRHLAAAKVPVNEMARQLGRHRSTIYREIKRNTFHGRELPDYNEYYRTVAHDISTDRRGRLRKLRRHPALCTEIIDQLEARWSPEQIAGRLLSDGLSRIRVCEETIYRFIDSKENYGFGLYQYLPETRRNVIQCAPESPATVRFQQRIAYPHDLILLEIDRSLGIGRATSSSSNVQGAMPMSPLSWSARAAIPLSSKSEPILAPIMNKIIRAFSPLPAFARQSFTFDRGTEFAGFRALEDGIGARSWFCDPSAPCQKWTVENTDKPFRRYLPGTTDLAVVSPRDLLHLARHINDQPRKCLGYKTPSEVFVAHLHGDR